MNQIARLISTGVSETIAIGRTLAAALRAGDVVALVGPLGAGKTHLVKGIAVGLGVPDEKMVNSPTFVLVNEYAGRVPVNHVDAYRLADASQLEAIGFDEMCDSDGVVLVEWADRVTAAIDENALWVTLGLSGEERRSIELHSRDVAWSKRLAAFALDRWTAKT